MIVIIIMSIISSGLTEFVSKSSADSSLKLVGRTENVMPHLVRVIGRCQTQLLPGTVQQLKML